VKASLESHTQLEHLAGSVGSGTYEWINATPEMLRICNGDGAEGRTGMRPDSRRRLNQRYAMGVMTSKTYPYKPNCIECQAVDRFEVSPNSRPALGDVPTRVGYYCACRLGTCAVSTTATHVVAFAQTTPVVENDDQGGCCGWDI
jgi:hypothetical protein